MKFIRNECAYRFERRASGRLLAVIVLIASAVLMSAVGCGKYGRPHRISQAAPVSISTAAVDSPAPGPDDALDDEGSEDDEPEGSKP